MGLFTSIALGVMAAASLGTSIYQSSAQATAAKKAANKASSENKKAVADAKAAEVKSASQAIERQDEFRRKKTQTIFSNPLDTQDQAITARKSLLAN